CRQGSRTHPVMVFAATPSQEVHTFAKPSFPNSSLAASLWSGLRLRNQPFHAARWYSMTSVALVTVLRAAGRAGVAVCLWGDPGIGKSALIQAAAAADDVPCEIVIGSLREPSDFAGLPVVTDDGVRLEPPSWAKRLHEAG